MIIPHALPGMIDSRGQRGRRVSFVVAELIAPVRAWATGTLAGRFQHIDGIFAVLRH